MHFWWNFLKIAILPYDWTQLPSLFFWSKTPQKSALFFPIFPIFPFLNTLQGLSFFFFFGTRPGPPSNFERARAKKKIKYQKKITCFGCKINVVPKKKNSKKKYSEKKLLKFSNFFFYTFLCTPHRHIFFLFFISHVKMTFCWDPSQTGREIK